MPPDEPDAASEIIYTCPDCHAETALTVGLLGCAACGRLMPLIMIDDNTPISPIRHGASTCGMR